jgi:hypothetical protein
VQSAINDGRLTLGDGGKMKLDTDPFPVSMVELMDKKVLVHKDQAEMTKGKNVVISNELRIWMIKPYNPEIRMWKENVLWKPSKRVKPTPAMLIEKYQRQLEEDRKYRVTRGIRWDRFFKAQNQPDQRGHGVQGSPGGGQFSTLHIGNLGEGKIPSLLIGRVWVTQITVLIILMCCTTKEDRYEGQNRPRSTS